MKPISTLVCLIIRAYQLVISPWLPPSCRFEPSCSNYTIQAVRVHGPIIGLILAGFRILRCNPYGGEGYDPVPKFIFNRSARNARFPRP